MKFRNKTVLYPDFTVLNKRTREIYYYEHFGMMDDSQYSMNVVKRINLYEENGIFPGERLIFTMETKETPFRKNDLERVIKKYFL